MATYTFWYSETYTNKGWFTADNKEQAIEMLDKIRLGEIDFEELPDFGRKDKNYEVDISPETIEEIDNA
jgi:hypothetical protein